MDQPTQPTIEEIVRQVAPIPLQSQLALYYALGMSLSQWTGVESGLAMVAKALVPEGGATFFWGFEKLGSLEAKIKFIDAAISVKDDEKISAIWFGKNTGLRQGIKGYAELRNKLAHWGVIHDARDQPFAMRLATPLKTGRGDEKSLTAVDVWAARFKFFSLMMRLFNLADVIQGKDPTHSEKELEWTTQMFEDELRLMAHVPPAAGINSDAGEAPDVNPNGSA